MTRSTELDPADSLNITRLLRRIRSANIDIEYFKKRGDKDRVIEIQNKMNAMKIQLRRTYNES